MDKDLDIMYEPAVVKILTTEAAREQSTKPTDNTGRTRIEVNVNALPYIAPIDTRDDGDGSTDSGEPPGEFTSYLQGQRLQGCKMPTILNKPQMALQYSVGVSRSPSRKEFLLNAMPASMRSAAASLEGSIKIPTPSPDRVSTIGAPSMMERDTSRSASKLRDLKEIETG